MTRYYAETPCEHGQMRCPEIVPWPVNPDDPGEEAMPRPCPGGLRRELTDIEIVEAEWDGHGRAYLPFSGSSTGRYLIAPLDE